ncbi:MAG: SAM-dependent methyltransferase [Leucobacter sp.]|nr:SAM-dependent methyltransferase [Leucobacter sp.]
MLSGPSVVPPGTAEPAHPAGPGSSRRTAPRVVAGPTGTDQVGTEQVGTEQVGTGQACTEQVGTEPTGVGPTSAGPTSAARPTTAPPGWEILLRDEGRQHLRAIAADLAAGASLEHAGARLRAAGVAPESVAALLTQTELRAKARTKFGEAADRLLFTPAGLEQASRASVAALHAERFAAAGCRAVADLGCGIGTESRALIAAGVGVLPVEIDPFTAAIAEANLSAVMTEANLSAVDIPTASLTASDLSVQAGTPVRVDVRDAEQADLTGADAAFLDPARRTAGHRDTRRLTSPHDYSPSLEFAFDLGERMPTGIKLGPGFDRELIPPDAEAQWVSVDGQLVETGLWFGAVARPGVRRAALVIRGAERHELTAPGDASDVEPRPLGEYVHEPDGAVIRARLIGALADRIGAGMVSEGIAYLTSDTAVPTPFAQTFRVLERLPAGEKPLRRALAERGIGRLEIKKRGVPVDPAALRTRLRLRGSGSATLILTRAQGAHVALLAERL